ncbi:FadR/GntR family transcriptional regulator [Kitasatospora sp. NPDC057198]|uniref:FadR/GntR family transcriptional regulator n=1 Tax=Kitasatospora sp. NPDC057198 TaxID=3346046 RepID=UPI00363BFBE6
MPVTDEAIVRIKEMILGGELAPGAKLPKEADLAERLGLSRNSLREAVKALSLIRVLDVRQGDGTYVTSLEPELLLDTLAFVVDFQRDDTVLHFLQVRRILEPEATALAARAMTDAQVAALGELLAALPEDASLDELLANDLEFHRLIAIGSGNPVLVPLLDGISAPTTRARIWRGLTEEGATARTREQHRAIHSALARRDADLARALALAHVCGVEQWLRDTLGGPAARPSASNGADSTTS